MIYYFDTSALIKRYILEKGSETVDHLFELAETIYVSTITKIECTSAITRLLSENKLTLEDYEELKSEVFYDFNFFISIHLDPEIERIAIGLIETHKLRTLDSIQLACSLSVKNQITAIVLSDSKLESVARQEGIQTINPIES